MNLQYFPTTVCTNIGKRYLDHSPETNITIITVVRDFREITNRLYMYYTCKIQNIGEKFVFMINDKELDQEN